MGTMLKTGDKVPALKFKDITGREGSNTGLEEYISVYSFADRKSSKALMNWMEDAQMRVAQAHPGLKLALYSVADLAIVPSKFSGMVRPILEKINDYAMKKLRKNYAKKGINYDSLEIRFFMIPDWSGEILKAFGLRDAKEFRTFVAKRDEIVGVFDSRTPRIVDAFCELCDRITKE